LPIVIAAIFFACEGWRATVAAAADGMVLACAVMELPV
jgi:hypothetical protein